jgi:hypothetical protein
MGKRKTYDPPRCPCCGADLLRVLETNYLIYEFDQAKGKYGEIHGEVEMKCPECQADLYNVFPYNVFPDGVCNFSVEIVEASD